MAARARDSEPARGGAADQPAADAPAGAAETGAADAAPMPASYERARDELAEVVATLEEGGLSLDESLALWERGQALARACETFLAGARARVERALADSDEGDDSIGRD